MTCTFFVCECPRFAAKHACEGSTICNIRGRFASAFPTWPGRRAAMQTGRGPQPTSTAVAPPDHWHSPCPVRCTARPPRLPCCADLQSICQCPSNQPATAASCRLHLFERCLRHLVGIWRGRLTRSTQRQRGPCCPVALHIGSGACECAGSPLCDRASRALISAPRRTALIHEPAGWVVPASQTTAQVSGAAGKPASQPAQCAWLTTTAQITWRAWAPWEQTIKWKARAHKRARNKARHFPTALPAG